ncbi:MAG: TOMM precursor leader peptide-binding protein [Pikeienuella sp.]
MPDLFLHWTEPPNANGEEVFRLASWRRSFTLKGKSFKEFEEEVVPLLSGQHTIDEICEKVAHVFKKDEVSASLNFLAAQGVVVEGDTESDRDRTMNLNPQLGWFSETAPDGRAAQQKLVDAHVVIFGAGAHGAVAARSLVSAGVGGITIIDPTDVTPVDRFFSALYRQDDVGKNRAEVLIAALQQEGTSTKLTSHASRPPDAAAIAPLIKDASLVLCCLESGELNLALKLNSACRQAGIRWIAASLEGSQLIVGPGFPQTADGPCYMCWRLREIAASANPQSRFALESQLDSLQTDLSGRRENLSASADIVGGMLSAEALTWLTEIGPPNLTGRFLLVELPGLRTEKHTVLRKPGCPGCSNTSAAQA